MFGSSFSSAFNSVTQAARNNQEAADAAEERALRARALDQQQALVIRDIDGLGGFDDAGHIDRRDLLVTHDDHAG